jgi:hypothetical protein
MNPKPILAYASALLLLHGCSTLSSQSKSMVLSPEKGQNVVVVESVATSKCTELFGNVNCEISIDLHQAHREGMQPVIAPSSAAPTMQPQSTQSKSNKSNASASERLKALEELKNNHMITDDEYRTKRQQIMDEM